MYLIALILIAGILIFLFYASACIRSGVYLKALCRVKRTNREVVLTFDDGVDPERTPKVLDILRNHNAKAVFFLIGQRAEAYPQLVRRICDEGHQIGIHTYSHQSCFPLKSCKEIRRELLHTQEILERLSGRPINLFRPPFGVTNPNIARVVRELNYRTIGWSIRSLDTMRCSRKNVLNRILRKLQPGAIILLHDDREQSDVLLDKLLNALQEKGYSTILVED